MYISVSAVRKTLTLFLFEAWRKKKKKLQKTRSQPFLISIFVRLACLRPSIALGRKRSRLRIGTEKKKTTIFLVFEMNSESPLRP